MNKFLFLLAIPLFAQFPSGNGGVATPANGGTGTSILFTPGSVVFAGASGVYTQDNANFFYDATNHRLCIGSAACSNALSVTGVISGSSDIFSGAANAIYWNARTTMYSPSNGAIQFTNLAKSSFTLMNFGPNTSSFPALKVSGTGLQFRLGDDSGFTTLQSGLQTATVPSLGVTNADGMLLSNPTAATIGAQQVSPSIHFSGSGFGTTGSAAQVTDCIEYLLPVQGTVAPSGTMTWACGVNGGAYSNVMTVTSGGQLGLLAGINTSPSLSFGGDSTTGFYRNSSNQLILAIAGNRVFNWYSGAFLLSSGASMGWSSTVDASATTDTQLSRSSPGVVAVGTTTANSNGTLLAAGYKSGGTIFVVTSGSATATSGGASAGRFTLTATGVATIVLTMGNSATAATGWDCGAPTNLTALARPMVFTTSNATTVTFTGTPTSGDVISFHCMGY